MEHLWPPRSVASPIPDLHGGLVGHVTAPVLLRLPEATSFLPPLTQTMIEDGFSDGVRKKGSHPSPSGWPLKPRTQYVSVLLWSRELGSEVFALWKGIRVRVGQRMVVPEHNNLLRFGQPTCFKLTRRRLMECLSFFQWKRPGGRMMAASFAGQNSLVLGQ